MTRRATADLGFRAPYGVEVLGEVALDLGLSIMSRLARANIFGDRPAGKLHIIG